MAEYCLLTFSLSLNNTIEVLCKNYIHGQSHVTDVTFRGQILELKLFLTYFS